jgi:hypothetical protein
LILISMRLVAAVLPIMIQILNAASVKLLGEHFFTSQPFLIEIF